MIRLFLYCFVYSVGLNSRYRKRTNTLEKPNPSDHLKVSRAYRSLAKRICFSFKILVQYVLDPNFVSLFHSQGNLAMCSPLTPTVFVGLGFYLTRIDCWRSDSSYLSAVFEKNRSKNRDVSIFFAYFHLYGLRLFRVPILKNLIFGQSTCRRALPEVEGPSPTPKFRRSSPPKIVSVAGPFENFDGGLCDLDWFELSSHQDFTFNRLTLQHAPNLLTPTSTPFNPPPAILALMINVPLPNTLHAYYTVLHVLQVHRA